MSVNILCKLFLTCLLNPTCVCVVISEPSLVFMFYSMSKKLSFKPVSFLFLLLFFCANLFSDVATSPNVNLMVALSEESGDFQVIWMTIGAQNLKAVHPIVV